MNISTARITPYPCRRLLVCDRPHFRDMVKDPARASNDAGAEMRQVTARGMREMRAMRPTECGVQPGLLSTSVSAISPKQLKMKR